MTMFNFGVRIHERIGNGVGAVEAARRMGRTEVYVGSDRTWPVREQAVGRNVALRLRRGRAGRALAAGAGEIHEPHVAWRIFGEQYRQPGNVSAECV